MNNEQRIQQLENQVKELLAWKEARMRQQLTFPLDKISQDIVHKDVPVWNGTIAENFVQPTGFMCAVNGRLWAFYVDNPSVYE